MRFSRRSLLAAAGCLGAAPLLAAEWPAKPAVPTDFNAKECFDELAEKGAGIHFGNADADITVRVLFDTQCPWCLWQFEQFKPYLDRVEFVWYPVAVLNPWSELQGASILAAGDPAARFAAHEAHFKDAEFRGLDVRNESIPFEKREAVWTNSKIFRRAAGREVPFGVMKMPDGRYIPVAQQTRADFSKLIGF